MMRRNKANILPKKTYFNMLYMYMFSRLEKRDPQQVLIFTWLELNNMQLYSIHKYAQQIIQQIWNC